MFFKYFLKIKISFWRLPIFFRKDGLNYWGCFYFFEDQSELLWPSEIFRKVRPSLWGFTIFFWRSKLAPEASQASWIFSEDQNGLLRISKCCLKFRLRPLDFFPKIKTSSWGLLIFFWRSDQDSVVFKFFSEDHNHLLRPPELYRKEEQASDVLKKFLKFRLSL